MNQLKHFSEVYYYRNISKAAKQLYITQQGLSKSIKNLEAEFKTKLFIRTQQGVVPTAFADSIINNVRTILDEEDSIKKKLDGMMRSQEKIVTVSCSNMMLQVFPIGTQVKIESCAPNAAWIYRERTEKAALEDVLNEKCDFAFISSPLNEQDYRITRILDYPPYCMVHVSSPLARKRVLHLADLEKMALIPFSKQWNYHDLLFAFFKREKFNPIYEFLAEDPIHMYTIVNNKLGIGILPSLYINYLPHSQNIKFVPFDEDIPWSLSIITKKSKKTTDIIQMVTKSFFEQAEELKKRSDNLGFK